MHDTSKAQETSSKIRKTPRKHISEQPLTWSNWYQHLHWIHMTATIFLPGLGFCLSASTPLRFETAIASLVGILINGLGITAGYHRLFAHRAYNASKPLKVFLAIAGGAAVEGSIRVWCREHRAHHRYIDKDGDPYSAQKGLLYCHMGWLVLNTDPKNIGRVDISDLNEDPIVRWQHKYYEPIIIVFAYFLPVVVCGLGWEDWMGGLVYAGLLRVFIVQQCTFCINSLGHWLGDQPFDDKNTPRNHWITSLFTFGEGYHNFHHEFPTDYRTGADWYQIDPTKWFLWTMKVVGLAYGLKTFSHNAIEMGRYQQEMKKMDRKRSAIDFGKPVEKLPVMEWDDFKEQTANGHALICISGIVHDVGDFTEQHPGGRAMIKSGFGKDATAMFSEFQGYNDDGSRPEIPFTNKYSDGGVYDHSNAAHNFLVSKRVAILRGGMEVEMWKKAREEGATYRAA